MYGHTLLMHAIELTYTQGIKDEFNLYQPVDTPENETFLKQNCDIWEHLQPEEERLDDDDILLGMENGRWITVEQEDSGDESEKVLFRTFVNAAIGSRRVRIMSKGAAYMLILSTKEGESEPRVTLCNQSGTLCLTRDCKSYSSHGLVFFGHSA
jgi:hypothetical protein